MDKVQRSEIMERLKDKEFLSADMPLETLNSDKRTVDIIFFTGTDIPRYDYWNDQPYVLRFDPKGADLSLLNNGAPILDNHSLWDGSTSQKGKVEKAWYDAPNFKASIRFSKRKSNDELWGDVEDRIVTKFSMGVSLLEVERIDTEDGGVKKQVRLARRWQPFELSVAPIPADFGTTTLAAERGNSTRANAQEERNMPEHINPGTPAGEELDTARAAELAAKQVELKRLQDAEASGAAAELVRVSSILEVTKKCRLPASFAQKHITGKTPLDKVKTLAIDLQVESQVNMPDTVGPHAMILNDERDTRRELMGVAVDGMLDPKSKKSDSDNSFIGLTIKQIAQESVRLQYNLRGIPKNDDLVKLSMQNTADFANVLENSARKQLLARYAYANPTYRVWTKRSTTPDFKTMSRSRLGETPEFLTVPEGQQITIGTMADSKETYALATYGRGVSFTRQMLVNDDLGAFNDLIGAFGVQAARLENKTVYAILQANANMSDGHPLFDNTYHANTGSGVLGNTAFDLLFGTMGVQTGVDAASVLNLTPKFVIVPKAKEGTAMAALMLIGPNVKASDQNLYAGRLTVVADAELDTNGSGTTKWYAAADPNDAPGIEYAHLEGQEGPQFIRKDNEQGILGMQFYAYLDFAAKAVDWRPLYYSTGS